jgi:ankyrin repeat protein
MQKWIYFFTVILFSMGCEEGVKEALSPCALFEQCSTMEIKQKVLDEPALLQVLFDTVACNLLYKSAKRGKLEKVKYLLESGVPINTQFGSAEVTALHGAASGGRVEIVQYLLKEGGDYLIKNRCGETPFYVACQQNQNLWVNPPIDLDKINFYETAKVLFEAGSAIDIINCSGETPLHEAISVDNTPTVKLLLENGADANHKDDRGLSPIWKLRVTGNFREIVNLLVDYGADINATNNAGDNIGRWTIRGSRNSVSRLKFLISKGLNYSTVDTSGNSYMHYAASLGGYDMMLYILTLGLDVNQKNNRGLTPLFFCVGFASANIKKVNLLLAQGANPKVVNDNGENLLHYAVQYTYSKRRRLGGNIPIIKRLIEEGVDPFQKDDEGKTAYDLATDETIKSILLDTVNNGPAIDEEK